MHVLSIELDDEARALYMTLTTNPVVNTVEVTPDKVFVDLDAEGEVVGIEVLEITSDGLPDLLSDLQKLLQDVQDTMGRELALA